METPPVAPPLPETEADPVPGTPPPFIITAIALSKEENGVRRVAQTINWRPCDNEDEARGAAVAYAQQQWPEFAIDLITMVALSDIVQRQSPPPALSVVEPPIDLSADLMALSEETLSLCYAVEALPQLPLTAKAADLAHDLRGKINTLLARANG